MKSAFSPYSRPLLALIALLTTAVTALPAGAAETPATLQNHDDKFAGTLMAKGKWPGLGTIIATRFRPEHKFALHSIELRFQGVTGRKVELHVWSDNGGLQPGAPEGWYTTKKGADLMNPKKVWIDTIDEMQSVDLKAANVVLPPVEPFWVGIKVLEHGATLGLDAYEKDKNPVTTLFQTPTGDCKDGCGVGHDLMVTVKGAYVDPADKRWFTDVTIDSGL